MIFIITWKDHGDDIDIIVVNTYDEFKQATEGMCHDDFAVIKGDMLKSFSSKKDYKQFFK